MNLDSDILLMYADFGEDVIVAGLTVRAIFSGGDIDPGGLGVASTAPSIRCRASDTPTVVHGTTIVRGSTTYTARNVSPIGPDELELRIELEQV